MQTPPGPRIHSLEPPDSMTHTSQDNWPGLSPSSLGFLDTNSLELAV